MLLSESLSFNIFFNVPFDKVSTIGCGHRGTSASTDHVFLFKKMILVEIYTKEFTNIE